MTDETIYSDFTESDQASVPRPHTVEPQPVIRSDFPDPDVLKAADGTYYAYSTSSINGRIPVASAPSATGPWTVKGDALPNKPSWAGDGGFWAPDVSALADGSYVMYFAAPNADPRYRRCVGAAMSTTPLGPFKPVGGAPLVCDAANGGAIDPSGFVDSDGKRYLVYKSDRNAIKEPAIVWLQQVGNDGITLIDKRRELIRSDQPEEALVVEAPYLVKRPSQYVLFYSGASYAGNKYFTSYATSASLTGSYTKAYRPLMTTETFDGAVQGPGGATVVGNHIFFHGWVKDSRWMYIADLGWANDLPVVRGSRVRYEAERGVLHDAVVRTGVKNASQGAVVAKLDNNDSWVDISVYVPTAGDYTAYVCYAAGYGDAQHKVTVNDGTQFTLNYPNRGWDNWTQVGLAVTLNTGWNTLRFQHLSRWAELDYIEVA